MKYLIDKEKLDARIAELLAGDGRRQADNVEGIALCALRKCLVPYEEKKEIPSILYGNGCGGTKDNRCTKCNGTKEVLSEECNCCVEPCQHCNFTGKEPSKEQDTRTHAWETPDTDKKIAEL